MSTRLLSRGDQGCTISQYPMEAIQWDQSFQRRCPSSDWSRATFALPLQFDLCRIRPPAYIGNVGTRGFHFCFDILGSRESTTILNVNANTLPSHFTLPQKPDCKPPETLMLIRGYAQNWSESSIVCVHVQTPCHLLPHVLCGSWGAKGAM